MSKAQKVTLKFTLTDQSTQDVSFTVPAGADGEQGPAGEQGTAGAAGVGIASVTVSQQDVD